jgi:2-polyprenyl-6-methoxyphenol hydroxylase-like FAD-dependent oxidoreductase
MDKHPLCDTFVFSDMAAAPAKLTMCIVKPPDLENDPFHQIFEEVEQVYMHYMVNIHISALSDAVQKDKKVYVPSDTPTKFYVGSGGDKRYLQKVRDAQGLLKTLKSTFDASPTKIVVSLYAYQYYNLYAQWMGRSYVQVDTEKSVASASPPSVDGDSVIVAFKNYESNGTQLRDIFLNDFRAMLAACKAYRLGFTNMIDLDVLADVVPFITRWAPLDEKDGSAKWFKVMVDEVCGANINVLRRITIGVSQSPASIAEQYETFLRDSFYCFDSYRDTFNTEASGAKRFKLSDGVTLPATETGAAVKTSDRLRLCFKRLEYYPVFEWFGGTVEETLIVGAGPTGLYTAYLMACLNKPFTLIESRQRWQSKIGHEAWTFLSRTQSIYLNTRWWEHAKGDQQKDIWKPDYRFVNVSETDHPRVRAAKKAVMQELDKYTLMMTGTPFEHRAHTEAADDSGYRCIQIWEAQEVLLRMLIDKLKTFKEGRIWFNAKLNDSELGFATIARNGVERRFQCKRIVSCTGALATDKEKTIGFIDGADKVTAKALMPVTVQTKTRKLNTKDDFDLIALVMQPSFSEKDGWTHMRTIDAANQPPGDNLAHIRFFPGHDGGLGYVAYVCKREEFTKLGSGLPEDLKQKIRKNNFVKKNGHSSLEASEVTALRHVLRRFVSPLNPNLQSYISKCNTITWAPGLKLVRRSKSAFGTKGNVVYLGDACAQPNFFTGTGLASGWSMAESFAMALSEPDNFQEHNNRVEKFVGKPKDESASKLYKPSNDLFLAWGGYDALGTV